MTKPSWYVERPYPALESLFLRFCKATYCRAHLHGHLTSCKSRFMQSVCGYVPQWPWPDDDDDLEKAGFYRDDSDFSDDSDLNSGFLHDACCHESFPEPLLHRCESCAARFCEQCKGLTLEDKRYANTVTVCKNSDCMKNARSLLWDKRLEYFEEFGYSSDESS